MNEESAYRYWITHHRDGFVLDGRHRPTWKVLNLHRADCPLMKDSANKRTHWTTGARFKACSVDRLELSDWAAELGCKFAYCTNCSPEIESSGSSLAPRPLSKLSVQIIDYVLEVAAMHFDDDEPVYQLTIGLIASCMDKSLRQIMPALQRLMADGYLENDERFRRVSSYSTNRIVYPTALALRMLPYFSDLSDAVLLEELGKLRDRSRAADAKYRAGNAI